MPKQIEHQLLNTHIITLQRAGERDFLAACTAREQEGFMKKESSPDYAAYQKDDVGCFITYWPSLGEVRIVTEQGCRYFDYADPHGDAVTVPQLTQIHLEDFGMSYAVRLSDGRFILIDGGCSFPPDAERLWETLKAGSPFEKPIVAAWIMTHPHSDHFHCIFPFMERHEKELTIEKFLFHFPAADDTDHYPKMTARDLRREVDTSNTVTIPQFLSIVERSGAAVYTPHCGQRYQIGDAKIEILSTIDETVHCSNNINATSLVFRMELGGQVILWGADATFEATKLAERYGEHLKANILQIPHHGFSSGADADQIRAFDLIAPETCLLPASDYVGFTYFSIFKKGTRHLLTHPAVREVLSGEQTRTLTLPYTPPPYAEQRLAERFQQGQASAGARAWYFTNLSTARAEDFRFTVINPVANHANLTIELYFEAPRPSVRFIKAVAKAAQMVHLCITDPAQVETETIYFNPNSLQTLGIPEDAEFAVRFLSDSPVVISHRDHPATYHD